MFIKTTNNTADKIQAEAQFSLNFYIFHFRTSRLTKLTWFLVSVLVNYDNPELEPSLSLL